MASDLQIIDGFERLRAEYLAACDGAVPAARAVRSGDAAVQVIEAWIQAIDGRPASAGQPLRRVRAFTRAILSPDLEIDTGLLSAADQRRIKEAERIRSGLERAKKAGLSPLAERPTTRTCAEEAAAWRRYLPAIAGVKAWRLIERLGRPAIIPDAPLCRFFWRFGLLDEQIQKETELAQVQAAAERAAVQTGIPVETLHSLIRWAIGGVRSPEGGGWCGAKPRCAACPLRAACTWARFHPQAPAGEPARPRFSIEEIRRRLDQGAAEQVSEAELLTTLIGPGAAGIGAMDIAEALLARFGDLRSIERATFAELEQVRGVTRGRATQIRAALELGRRFAMVALAPGDPIRCAEDIWRAYRGRFRNLPQEHFVIVLLDSKNRILRDHIVSKGSLTGSIAHPREVFQQAIRHAASGVILMHNHPSGDPTPSREDKDVTNRLKEAGEILGIRVLDHIVLGSDAYYSFKDEGDI